MKNTYDEIIKKSVNAVKKYYKQEKPKIFDSFYIGNYNMNPRHLVIFYVFKTDFELQYAKENELTENIEKETIKKLISNGYPEFAFEAENNFDISGDTIIANNEKCVQQFIDKMNCLRASVIFISEEDVKEKTNSNLHEYLQ